MVIYIYIYIERERERERERDHEGRTKKWTHPHVNNSYNVDKCVNFKLGWMKIFDIKPR